MIISPLTNLSDVTLIKTFDSQSLISDWKNVFDIDISEELHNHPKIYLYRCNKSSLKFFMPLDVAGSDKLYKQLEEKYDWYYMPRKWEHDVAIQDLDGCTEILEVGCGRGAFVERICKEIGANGQGLEFNKNAIIHAQNSGIPVTDRDIYQLAKETPHSFDAICTFQVLEHIPEVKKFLESLIQLLKPDGKLIISVPNNHSFTKHYHNDLLDQPPHHMTQWSVETFEFLTQIFPIKIENYRYEPLAEYHVNWYLSIQLSRLPKLGLLNRFLNKGVHVFVKPLLKQNDFLRKLIIGHTIYVCFHKLS